VTTKLDKFLADRRTIVGGSDIGSIMKVSKWSCPLRTFYSKTEEKDFDNSKKKEFRRGHRLEAVAATYYSEETGRLTKTVPLQRDENFPHLGVHMDRLTDGRGVDNLGYLEIKVVGEWSFRTVKKEGAYPDWITQVQYGCAVTKTKWGAIAVYWPDGDELLTWDFDADPELGAQCKDVANDFWMFHVETGIAPEPLPLGSETCRTCEWRATCPNGATPVVETAFAGVVDRPDIAALVREYREAKAYGKESDGRVEDLKGELMAALKDQPGVYRWEAGEPLLSISETTTDRFDSKGFRAAEPDLYKKFVKTSKSKRMAFKGDDSE
jgi:predicted phage-related endonuclease